ncbi:hypothetical protein PVAP13_9NG810100 [Panicum virgatum]|uniref:Uncharacterized protein n=1 Tax=Panicum virgatum TaxID=38727 RepID=A0A8T0N5E5_PANVG|nr:hypothetical protein PVAP13_9NG810100 [Panicum virgatum]
MAPSGKNSLSAAVLLIVIVAAVLCSMPTCTRGECHQYANGWCECRHLSGSYAGPCLGLDHSCNETCLSESSDNIYGMCDKNAQCSCYTKCAS